MYWTDGKIDALWDTFYSLFNPKLHQVRYILLVWIKMQNAIKVPQEEHIGPCTQGFNDIFEFLRRFALYPYLCFFKQMLLFLGQHTKQVQFQFKVQFYLNTNVLYFIRCLCVIQLPKSKLFCPCLFCTLSYGHVF